MIGTYGRCAICRVTAEFDGAFCFGNSFGYLNDEANADFLQGAFANAETGRTRFILDAPAIAE